MDLLNPLAAPLLAFPAGTTLLGVVVSWLASYAGIAALRRWAATRLLDVPNERSSHVRPTPRGGGLLIVLITLAGWLAFALAYPLRLPVVAAYGVGAGVIALVSGLDDLHDLSNRVRFGTHSLAALLALLVLGPWHEVALPLLGTIPLGWLGWPVTFLWIVGLTNAYNFMDGIDGLAGSQAVVAGAGWALWGAWQGEILVALLGVLLATSSLGFLAHNWPPARIFMGDVGSAFLGYSLALLPLLPTEADPRLPLVGALLVWPFLFDSLFTFLCRLRRGENVFAAHRSHLYQRLVIQGLSHRAVTLRYIALALVGTGLAAAWWAMFRYGALAIALALPALALAHWADVARREQAVLA